MHTGFSPPALTLFAPSVYLATRGPDRASRSIALFENQIDFYRAVFFHPVLTAELQAVQDAMPPRQVTMLRAARLYSDPRIPWIRGPGGIHEIIVTGSRHGGDFVYRSASADAKLALGSFLSRFALRPAGDSSDSDPASVIGELEGGFELDSYGVDALIDVAAATLHQSYGDLRGPWDTVPGVFNQHDRAAIDRLRRDMPALASQLHRFFTVANIVDEFAGSSVGPDVLCNLEFTVRSGALASFPFLERFYSRIGPRVHALITFEDNQSGHWAIVEFDRGRMRFVFLDSAGMLRPFDEQYAPAGAPIALGNLTRGRYRVHASLEYTRFGLIFGLDDLSFVTDYYRDSTGIRFVTHMTGTPAVVAPPVLCSVVDYLAGQFLESLARSMSAELTSRALQPGRVGVSANWSAELTYSPSLEILAGVGDSIADAHNAAVRADERRLGEDLFNAMITDYQRAKPAIRTVDNITGQTGDSR